MLRGKTILLSTATVLLSGALAVAPALAAGPTKDNPNPNTAMQNNTPTPNNNMAKPNNMAKSNKGVTTNGVGNNSSTMNTKMHTADHAKSLVNKAVAEVKKIEKDPQLKKLIAKAKGIYLVPEFGRGALIVGGRGGAGVVLAHVNGKWTNPVFYNFGSISFGAQAGASSGHVAFLLMDQSAVDAFKSGNKISLNAGAGLSIVTYSANGQASWGKGDIIMWSDTAGAYAGATISVTDLNWDDDTSKAYYGRKVDPSEVLAGKINTPSAEYLKQVMPG